MLADLLFTNPNCKNAGNYSILVLFGVRRRAFLKFENATSVAFPRIYSRVAGKVGLHNNTKRFFLVLHLSVKAIFEADLNEFLIFNSLSLSSLCVIYTYLYAKLTHRAVDL